MDKYQQIVKLAQAADLIYQVFPAADEKYHAKLIAITDSIADLADEIEGVE